MKFIEQILGEDGMRRSVVIAAPADTSPLHRIQGAAYATAVAEYFRNRGRHVLLIMDSLTRYAMAHREIALAIGEPPATKGYPPSVFAKLPKLVERAGNGPDASGSITAFYTVLMEGDDQQDPVADNARAILDGHIVLSRCWRGGHYPAIDVEASISRALSPCSMRPDGARAAFKSAYSRYQRNRDLIASAPMSRAATRRSTARSRSAAAAFLRQDANERAGYRKHLRAPGLFPAAASPTTPETTRRNAMPPKKTCSS